MMKGEAQKGAPPSKLSVGRVASARAGGSVGRGGGGRAAGVATRRTSAMEDRVPGLSAVAEEVVGLQTTPLVPTKGGGKAHVSTEVVEKPHVQPKGGPLGADVAAAATTQVEAVGHEAMFDVAQSLTEFSRARGAVMKELIGGDNNLRQESILFISNAFDRLSLLVSTLVAENARLDGELSGLRSIPKEPVLSFAQVVAKAAGRKEKESAKVIVDKQRLKKAPRVSVMRS